LNSTACISNCKAENPCIIFFFSLNILLKFNFNKLKFKKIFMIVSYNDNSKSDNYKCTICSVAMPNCMFCNSGKYCT